MRCVNCKGVTKVVDSAADYDAVIRKRMCIDCGKTFITIEIQSFDEEDAKRLTMLHEKQRKKPR